MQICGKQAQHVMMEAKNAVPLMPLPMDLAKEIKAAVDNMCTLAFTSRNVQTSSKPQCSVCGPAADAIHTLPTDYIPELGPESTACPTWVGTWAIGKSNTV